MDISIVKELDDDFATAVERVTQALQAEGFGILTEIDVQAKMVEKLGRDMEPYLILGACNPPLAWDAIHAVEDIGVLLPCNVVVQQKGDRVIVRAMEPKAALSLIDDATVHRVGNEASERLHRAMATL